MSAAQRGRLLVIAGEASGDYHAAKVVRQLQCLAPEIQPFGIGGPSLAATGMECRLAAQQLAVMGVPEILRRLPEFAGYLGQVSQWCRQQPQPAAALLVDAPEFNLRAAARIRAQGVPVFYYVSPQIWAWRSGRARTIARDVDRMATLFPFEPQMYQQLPLEVAYLGHPLLDELPPMPSRATAKAHWGWQPDTPVFGLFPGSRHSEIQHCFDTLTAAAGRLQRQVPGCRFLVAVSPSLDISQLQRRAAHLHLPLVFTQEDVYTVARAVDVAMCVSGTITLQLALADTPMVIIYRMAPLSYWLGRRLVRIPYIGLVNIVAQQQVVPELIQKQAQPEPLARWAQALLSGAQRQQVRQGLAQVREQLGEPGSSQRVAQWLLDLIRQRAFGGLA